MKWYKIRELSKELLDGLLQPEGKELEDEQLEKLAQKFRRKGYLRRKLQEQESFEYLQAYQKSGIGRGRYRRMVVRLCKRAAIVVLLVGAGALLYEQHAADSSLLGADTMAEANRPGNNPALLVNEEGKMLTLKQAYYVQATQTPQVSVEVGPHRLYYHVKPSQPQSAIDDSLLYNTLIVPRGGEYLLVLSDGTEIWLNADTRITYPICFKGTTREVSISGEAYFKVSKYAGKSFIVKTNHGNIRVLGTEFNVKDYPDDKRLTVTLVKGKIDYGRQGMQRHFELEPNQQLTVEGQEEPVLQTVNPYYDICWKDGQFMFQQQKLEDLFKQLERWYDVEVVYTDESLKQLHFSGELSRYKNVDTFVDVFERSAGIKMKIEGKRLIVSKVDRAD